MKKTVLLTRVLSYLICVMSALPLTTIAADLPTRQADEAVDNAEVRQRPGLRPNTNLLFNGWGVTPAGTHVLVSDLALKLLVAPDKKTVIATHGGFNNEGVTLIDLASQKQTQFFPLNEAWNGIAFSRDGHRFYVSGGDSAQIHIFNYKDGTATFEKSMKVDVSSVFLGWLAADPKTDKLYACDEANNQVLVLDAKTFAVEARIPVEEHPHTCVMGADGRHLYVSDWGSRCVSVVNVVQHRRVRDIGVGIRPNDMVLAPDGRLFVACSGDNTVHVIQTRGVEVDEAAASPDRRPPERGREIISTSLYPQAPEGSTPGALAISPNGHTLFIANADNNDVMVVDISNATLSDDQTDGGDQSISVANGFIPVGWYPSALAIDPKDGSLIVANGKGLASRPNYPPQLGTNNPKGHFDAIGHTLQGAISFIARPDVDQMAAYTKQVRLNSPYAPQEIRRASIHSDSVIPERVGDECPIKYILYIIKENRTYDQVFGDFLDAQGKPAGNGDSNIVMYGENVTPNHHQIARDYVLFDNLYCNSEVSVDGHSWCDAAIATDFNQRSWILSYSHHGVLPGNNDMMVPSSGYLWDLCKQHGITFKNYGEGALRVPSANRGKWKGARDTERVKFWIDDLQAAEKSGVLPQFTIMSLGEDHTRGTKPGEFSPDASVGSNDKALGEIVEAASHSRFWPEMAIFVIEDDAQNGPDHVDAHRTVGLVVSPYCKRGAVDSTLYSTASMVRTMELILGLPPMTQYDAAATPMFNAFQKTAEVTPYNALPARVNLITKNTRKSPGAKESARMDFQDYDLAPEDALNRVLWLAAKGPDAPYPTPIHSGIMTR